MPRSHCLGAEAVPVVPVLAHRHQPHLETVGSHRDLSLGGSSVPRTDGFPAARQAEANDGEAGEHDNVMIGLIYLKMGSGNDLFVGSAGDEVVWALSGDDTMLGKGGADYLMGLSGHDTAGGGPGKDFCTAAEVRRSCEHLW